MMLDWGSPLVTFATAGLLSALAGIARQLSTTRRRKVCDVLVAGLYAGTFGLGVALLWYEKFRDTPNTLVGGCVLAALFGTFSANEVLNLLRMGLRFADTASAARGKEIGEKEGKGDD